MELSAFIDQYGFPIAAASGMGYIVYFVWVWATVQVRPLLEENYKVLVDLIEQIRVLDNDMIRLSQKLKTILQIREKK